MATLLHIAPSAFPHPPKSARLPAVRIQKGYVLLSALLMCVSFWIAALDVATHALGL